MTETSHDRTTKTIIKDRWKHRRRMAYIALVAILAVTYVCLFKIDSTKLDALEVIVTWFYVTMGSIIGAYVGFATLDDKWQNKKRDE